MDSHNYNGKRRKGGGGMIGDKLYKWKYNNDERPRKKNGELSACCYDCGVEYGTTPDVSVPNEIWEKINPTYYIGAGILCPSCITIRLCAIGAGETYLKIYAPSSPSSKYRKFDILDGKAVAE